MKIKGFILAALMMAEGAAFASAATNDVSALLQKGLFEEEANHNLDAAIQAYQSVIMQTEKDRQFAATAIFRLGECYRKQGKTNEANAQYQRILREFPEQTELAKLSRDFVGGEPAPASPQSNPAAAGPMTADQREEFLRIRALIQSSPDLINAPDKSGETFLQKAAARDQMSIAKYLLDNGALVNGLQPRELTPLHYAAGNGHKAMVDLLLSKGAKVDAQTESGTTPLHLAVSKGYEIVARTLIEAGAPVNSRLNQDVSHNNDDIQYAIPRSLSAPLQIALDKGFKDIAEMLLAHGADINVAGENGMTTLHLAASQDNTNMVHLLLSKGADVNTQDKQGQTALTFAIESGFEAVFEMLLANKADVNNRSVNGITPLITATTYNHQEMAKALLEHGADANSETSRNSMPPNWRALDFAIRDNKLEIAKLLLEKGADANTTVNQVYNGQNGYYLSPSTTPLMMSTLKNQSEMAKLLLEHGAEVNAARPDGTTALTDAIGGSHKDMVALLLEHHADPNLRTKDGNFPLYLTFNGGDQLEMSKLLLDHGADVNERDNNGESALHRAASSDSKAMVELLLAHGADVNLKDNQGKSPLDLAQGPNNPRAGGMPGMPGLPLPPPINYQWQFNQPNQPGMVISSGPGMLAGPGPQKKPDDVAALLREHGAVSEIEISSIRMTYGNQAPQIVFQKDADSFNHFSLLEVIASRGGGSWFPDFSKVTITHRGNKEPTKFDLLNGTNGIDCEKNVLLEFGDVVEVPERDHALSEQGVWLTSNQAQSLEECLARKITVKVKGETKELTRDIGLYLHDLMNQTDTLKVLRSTSDLTRVKVKRIDPVTKKSRELVVNTRERNYPNDVWMRDGDVVEVPERQEAGF